MLFGMYGERRVCQGCGREQGQHCTSKYPILSDDVLIVLFRLIGVPSSTCYMLTYDHLSHNVLPSVLPSPIVPLASGIFARTMITSLVSPLELVRTNLQSTPLSVDTPHTLRSVLTSIRAITQAQGIGYLWRGLGPTLWRDVPFSGLYWAGYEAIKSSFERRGREGAPVAFVSGAVSGTTAALLTSPFDVLKTRRQAIVMSTPERVTASFPLMVDIVRSEGVPALYAGILPRIVKIAPACGIMIACYEVSNILSGSTNFVLLNGNSLRRVSVDS